MALSYGEIKEWEPADAGALADAMQERITALGNFEEGLREGKAWKNWQNSSGADAADSSLTGIADHVTDLAAHAEVLRDIGADTERSLDALRPLIDNVESYASSRQFSISDAGTVTDLRAGEDMDENEELDRERTKRDIEQSVSEIIKAGRAIETDAASRLSSAKVTEVSDGGATSVSAAVDHQDTIGTPPPPEAGPYAARAWWNSLEGSQSNDGTDKTLGGEQEVAAAKYSDELRNLNGIPSVIRSEPNKSKLSSDISTVRDQLTLAEKEERRTRKPFSPRYPHGGNSSEKAQVNELRGKLAELQELEKASIASDTLLIGYDDSNPQLQAITAIGNPDSAKNVSVTTPGYTTNVKDSVGGMTDEARQLRNEAIKLSGSTDPNNFSTISFLGYQAPQDVVTGDLRVATPDAAFEGGRNLEGYLSGVAATNSQEDLQLSLYGHSYGSTTASAGAQYLAQNQVSPIDNFAVYGSPGMKEVEPDYNFVESTITDEGINPRSNVDNSALGINDANLYYMENDGDFVSGTLGDIGQNTQLGLGNSPKAWGMEELSTESSNVEYPDGETATKYDVDELNKQGQKVDPDFDVGAHSAFPKPNTTSQYNLAAILAGLPEKAIRN